MSANMNIKANGEAAFARANGTAKAWWERVDAMHRSEMALDATVQDWIKAAGMDFDVLEAPVKFHEGTVRMPANVYDRFKVLFRSDNSDALNVVGKRFKVVQPRDIMTEFFQPAIEQAGFELDTAGVLGKGERYWALAKTGSEFTLPDGKGGFDKYQGYLLLATSCDYSLPTIARFVLLRVVCQNTLDAALHGTGGKNTDDYEARTDGSGRPFLRITHRSEFDFDAALKAMSVIDVETSMQKASDQLAAYQGVRINDDEAKRYFQAVLGIDGAGQKRAKLGAQTFDDLLAKSATISQAPAKVEKDPRMLTKLMASYNEAPGAVPGTLYGAIQGVTHYVDHVRGWNSNRASSAAFGSGQDTKQKAVKLANEFIADRAASATLIPAAATN